MRKALTLRAFFERHPEIHDTVIDSINPFCVPLFFPNQIDIIEPEFGCGVCVDLCGKKGVLTNHHVAEIFVNKQHSYVYSPHPKTFRQIPLKLKQIISLPGSSNGHDVDIAFIELDSEGNISDLGRDWWNLISSEQKFASDPSRYWSKENISSWLWGFNATPDEGAELIEGISPSEKIVFYPNAGFHWAAPLGPVLSPCYLSGLTKDIDNFDLPISRNGVDGYSLPKSYIGTSGNGLWQIELIETSEGLKIQEIQLAGLVTEQSPPPPSPANNLICRGHVSLYETFLPFCTAILTGQTVEDGLKEAGFRQ